jgi:hypothetical protein
MQRGSSDRSLAAAVLWLAVLAPSLALPCSVIRRADYPLDPQQYILFGEVKGYAKLDELECDFAGECREAWGLKLTVVDWIYPLGRRDHTVELYFFGSDSMCSRLGVGRDALRRAWPIGAKVKLAAPEYVAYDDEGEALPPSGGTLRLERHIVTGDVARLPDDTDLVSAAAARVDYHIRSLDPRADAIELRKDFVRLLRADRADVDEIGEVLKRLAVYYAEGVVNDNANKDVFSQLMFDYNMFGPWRSQLDGAFEDELVVIEAAASTDTGDLDALERLAEQGNALAAFARGRIAADDRDEFAAASYWFDVAAHAGYPLAEVYAALVYRDTADDHDDALEAASLAVAEERFRHAAATARSLVAAGDSSGEMMLSELYALGVKDLGIDESRLHALACRGARLRPVWRTNEEQLDMLEGVEERGGSCEFVY